MPKDRDKKRSRFDYKPHSKEAVRAAANQKSGSYDSYIKDEIKTFKPREGKNTIRILPPTWDKNEYYSYEIQIVYGVGVDQQAYLSLSKMKGEKDPLEEARREAEADGDKKLADALQPKKRKCMFVIDRNAEEEGPQLWPAPFTVDRDIANLAVDEDNGKLQHLDDPGPDGHDFRFYKEGTGRNTTYPPAKMRILDASPLSEDEDQEDEWLDYITENSIPDCLQFYDYDHIKAVFGGVARRDDDDDDDEKDKKSSKRRRGRDDDDDKESKSSKRRRGADDDEEEEDKKSSKRKRDADEDDDDKKSSSRRRSRDDDDDEKDDRKSSKRRSRDDDDDDKEEKSSRRRKSEEEDDDDDKSSRRKRSRDDEKDDEDDKPKSRRRRSDDDEEEDDKKSSKRRRSEDDDDDGDRKSSKKRRDADEEEDEDDGKSSKKESVKDRLRKARSKREKDDD